MSYIDRLQIQGIRAFPTSHGETIEFGKPLTLIAGVNGSGKTTIIECLRFVTTGGLPPGAAQKGAWVHDPGLQGEKKVMAMAKLKFFAANGTSLVAARRLELEVKKGTSRGQRSAECSLKLERHGQTTTLSKRVAELDQQLPLYLGVSQSLLDNVIFCHQESSAWPLEESSVLKKKFDEIFEAGKYTKAVNELLQIRKKHRADLGRQQELANGAKKDRDRARRVEKHMQQLYDECEDMKRRVKDLSAQRTTAEEEAKALWDACAQFNQILLNLDKYRDQANSAENAINDLQSHMTHVSESDEWLETALREFDATLARYENEKQTKKTQYLEHEEQSKALKSQLDARLTERGQYEQEKRLYEQRLERRRDRIRESAAKHQIRGYSDLDDDAKVEEFLFKIKKISKDSNNRASKSRAESDKIKREAQVQINQLTEREKALKDNKINANRQIALNNREAGHKQADANSIQVNEGDKAVTESRIAEMTSRLHTLKETSKSSDYPMKIRKIDGDLASLKAELRGLNDELFQGTTRASEIAQLSHIKQELKEREQSLKTLSQAHGERVTAVLGKGWNPDSLEVQYRSKLEEVAKAVTMAMMERDAVVRQSEQLEFKQKTAHNELDARKTEVQKCETIVKEVIDDEISEYDQVLKSADCRLEQAQDAVKNVGGLADYFQRVLETAETKHACRLCDRAFKNAQDPMLSKFIKKLEGLVKKSANEEAEAELKEATEDHKRVMKAGVSYGTWKRLVRDEIPVIEKEIAKLGKDHDAAVSRIERHDAQVRNAQSAQKEVESISTVVSSVTKIGQDIKALESKLDQLTAKQSQSGPVKSLEDIREEIDAVTNRVQEHEKIRARLTEEQDMAKSEIRDLELELSEFKTELGNISRRLDQKTAFLARVDEYKAQNQKQTELIEKMNADLEKIGPELDTANARYEDIVERAEAELKELAADAASLADTVNALDLIGAEIEAYLNAGGGSNLPRVVSQIEKLKQNISQLEAAEMQLMKDIHKLDEQVRDSEKTRRHYQDNLRYRREVKNLKWLRSEIESLESKNAEADRDQLQRDSERKSREHHNLAMQLEGVRGELKSKDVQLQQLIEEYNIDLKDAAVRYREAHVRAESTKAAIEDIGTYSTALDQAITKYHTLKMEQVNTIIDELWKETYTGTDIDKIYIKSDLDVKANSRSHNYRVVMLKRDVELDMRGRCSAGQKVLASIIIRLALAECFSKDCGVIALDEPTTNLDEKNVAALADSLHKIIENRRRQHNFQLIIITHDENFLKQMHCEDFTDVYWKIERDVNDDSIIYKQDILKVMGK